MDLKSHITDEKLKVECGTSVTWLTTESMHLSDVKDLLLQFYDAGKKNKKIRVTYNSVDKTEIHESYAYGTWED